MEFLKPGPGSMFQPIQCLVKLADFVWFLIGLKPRRLFHEDLFFEVTIQESIVNIKLPDFPTRCDGNGENDSYGGWLDNWAEVSLKSKPGT